MSSLPERLAAAPQTIKFGAPEHMSKLFESDAQRFARNLDEAIAYHRRARLFRQDGMRVSLVFNVASIAIECYLIALCAYFRDMPFNHSYSNLVDDVERLMSFPPLLAQRIRALDKIFGICSLDDYHHGVAEESDALDALDLCDALQSLIQGLGPMPKALAKPNV